MSAPQLSIQTSLTLNDLFSDSRTHGYSGPSRNVRLQRACANGRSAICKSEDGSRCAVAGKESLRVLTILDPTQARTSEHKAAVGRGGHRVEASRNLWEGSGLKIDSASTDVAWGFGQFNNKILTSARNGEIIMWDLVKSKYERRTKDHTRSIHKLSVSSIVHHYCVTGSSDGDLRIWDIRDLSKSINRIRYPTTVRSAVFSPVNSHPLQVVVGLDNGSLYRWDLQMGQRGQLDRIPVAHTAPVTALDWCYTASNTMPGAPTMVPGGDIPNGGLGWIVSGGLDRCVKVWDLTWPSTWVHIPHKATYTLHPSFPVRQVQWRPSYECEIAIVSNAELGTGSNPDMSQPSALAGTAERGNRTFGLDVAGFGGRDASQNGVNKDSNSGLAPGMKAPNVVVGMGDAIEIWDVRRGWIAKWSVTGSAIEGGVTDMTFGDSHAIWAQHSSGMFSQIDLRDATKPLDAITKVSASWEASGTLAFVSNDKKLWEPPYDDVSPEQRERMPQYGKSKLKALGDSPYVPECQATGTYNLPGAEHEVAAFTRLAKGYRFKGEDRKQICALNAQLAFQTGRNRAGQVWLLVEASLADLVPEPEDENGSAGVHSNPVKLFSAPGNVPSSPSPGRHSLPLERTDSSATLTKKVSPGRGSGYNVDPGSAQRSVSGSRRMTPSSSKNSSPRQGVSPLPPGTPSPLGRRDSGESPMMRRPSVYRRPSVSIHSSSPGDRSTSSLRHVGEGALDDSDSSPSGNEDDVEMAGDGPTSGDEGVQIPFSPNHPARRSSSVLPSPLSHVIGHSRWSDHEEDNEEDDDDDDDASPSPRSTDSEYDDNHESPRPSPRLPSRSSSSKRSTRPSSLLKKSRSRSSTIASLPGPGSTKPLKLRTSQSSIKTVTVGEGLQSESANGIKTEETARDVTHQKEKSTTISEAMLDVGEGDGSFPAVVVDVTDRRQDLVRLEEKRCRDLAWEALRNALDDFADEGDMQMCAMLSVLVAKELRIDKRRVVGFLDSYIDKLARLRLHTCAAYLRKVCEAEEIRQASQLETTIYTSCGRCRKALALPLGTTDRNAGYWLCSACKAPPAMCNICRLPVRGLLFQCSICSHGGHHVCYQRYYMQRPMVHLPKSFLPATAATEDHRGRSVARSSTETVVDDDSSSTTSAVSTVDVQTSETTNTVMDKMSDFIGHPCAAGCGHFCWAANGSNDSV
ncbi:WD40 repeat-like protein [Guyanagaster necrorhizus]|uniref:WD40 repeat-like protein n=1 Tax=Guyanagaster necrorhizus TaxID=856835 RepID=A0A9P7W2W1_9AGAR|nr:WD40 repeat-like protein [Guyanagaster necrorhizus MCA 3950]KAG7450975.1 WD40 repeat-like protein [Guyanagaster necrorhizus MCA 3950]